jgi:hypothetical protein
MAARFSFVAFSIAFMILGRVADTLVTYYYSPGLELEANPLASVMGFGWLPLIAVNLLVLAAVSYCSVHWCRHPVHYDHSPEVRDFWSFASHACYGRMHPPLVFLCCRLLLPPTRRAHTLHLIGAVMPVTIVIISIVAVFSWQALYGTPWESYSLFYSRLWPVFPYGLVVPIVAIATVFFYRHEYNRYRQQWESTALEPAPAPVSEANTDTPTRLPDAAATV